MNGTGSHAWERLPGGGILFVTVMAVATGMIILADEPGPVGKTTAAALLAACWTLSSVVSRRGATGEQRDRVAGLYAVSLVLLFTAAAVIAPTSSFALFALGPQCFTVLPTRYAFGVVTLLNVTPALRYVVTGTDVHHVLNFVATAALIIVFSLVIGSWMCRVIRQSAERATLIEQLEASRAAVEKLSMERGVLAERERLARDIHDTLAQGFTSIIMLLEAAASTSGAANTHISRAIQTAQENLAEARSLVAELTPTSLANSLVEALRRLARSRQELLGFPVSFVVSGTARQLPADLEVALLRAAQESLTNVGKHAAASSAQLHLCYQDDAVTLSVHDDGCGFDTTTSSCDGYGLLGMRSRVSQVGGTIEIRSGHGSGTALSIVVPAPLPARHANLE